MSRFNNSEPTGFSCRHIGSAGWEIGWTMDFHYRGDRLRYPRAFRRLTDLAGAQRFCKKHGLPEPKALAGLEGAKQ